LKANVILLVLISIFGSGYRELMNTVELETVIISIALIDTFSF